MRTVKAALHEHFNTSNYISEDRVKKAIELAQKRLGPGGVFGIINFDGNTEDPRFHDFFEYAKKQGAESTGVGFHLPEQDLLAYKGQEVATKSGHVLFLGVPNDKRIKNGTSLEDALKAGRDLGAISVADHPFFKDGIGKEIEERNQLALLLDGIETFNGEACLPVPNYLLANEKAEILASRIRRSLRGNFNLVSSDGHSLYEFGRTNMNIEMPLTYFGLREGNAVYALKQGLISGTNKKLATIKNPYIGIIGALDHSVDIIAYLVARKLKIKK